MPTLRWMRAAAVVALATHAIAQKCYYPNGEEAAKSEKPCSSVEGSACCPDTWECLDNGLCHLPAGNLYGRYSCTDKDWKAEGCASNMCTISNGDVKAVGGESITQCKDHDDQWCCNADAVNVNCCKESPSPRPFFALQDGKAYATIGQNQASTAPNLATITGLAQSGGGSGGGNQASKTTAGGSSGSPSTDAPNSGSATATADDAATTPFSSVIQSLSTSAGGGVVTIQNTVLVTPTPTAGSSNSNNDSSSSNGGSKSNLGLIIGCAVGIPLALALVGIIFWLLRKRRQQKANPYHDPSSEVEGDSPLVGAVAGKLNKSKKETYRNSRPATAEIDGNPIGAGRANRVSELPSGNGFQPGHQGTPYGPDAVGIGGGNGDPNRTTWDTIPPQYSPAQAAFTHPEATELADTSVNPVLNEKGQPYQAYRPPQPVAELPSVTTPPEDVEKQMHHR